MSKWILINERLPEEGEYVLVTVKGYNECNYYDDEKILMPDGLLHDTGYCKHGSCEECQYASEIRYTDIEICRYESKKSKNVCFHDHNGWDVINETEEVIAWMPLPKPYKVR